MEGLNINKNKILFVDDETDVLEAFERRLRRQYNVEVACGGEEGLKLLKSKGPFAVIVSDMRMPKMSGLEFLKQVKSQSPQIVRIMLTGNTDQKTAIDAVNDGEVFKFITKPCGSKTLSEVLDLALAEYERRSVERSMLNGTVKQIIQLLCSVLSQGDPETWNKGMASMRLIKQMCEKMNVSDSWSVEMGALLCRLGVITIPWEIRNKWEKSEPLSEQEKALVDRVPEAGCNLLKSIPKMEEVANLVLYHQKFYDGTGFPQDGKKGKEIPQGAGLIRAALDFVELQNQGKSNREIVTMLKADSRLYDPEVITTLENLFPGRAKTVQAEVAAKKEISYITVKPHDLKIGMILLTDLLAADDSVIVKGRTMIDDVCLSKIKAWLEMGSIKEPIKVIDPARSA